MMPTQVRFTSERLCWFTDTFLNEFESHPPWQCAVVHPALSAAFRIEQSEDTFDNRERLTSLLSGLTRLAVFDHTTHRLCSIIAGLITAVLLLILTISGNLGQLVSLDLVHPVLVISSLAMFGLALFGSYSCLYRLAERVTDNIRRKSKCHEIYLTSAAEGYRDLALAVSDAEQLFLRYGVTPAKWYEQDFLEQVRSEILTSEFRAALQSVYDGGRASGGDNDSVD